MKYYITYRIAEEYCGEIEADSLDEAIKKASNDNEIKNVEYSCHVGRLDDWELYDDPDNDPIAEADLDGNIKIHLSSQTGGT